MDAAEKVSPARSVKSGRNNLAFRGSIAHRQRPSEGFSSPGFSRILRTLTFSATSSACQPAFEPAFSMLVEFLGLGATTLAVHEAGETLPTDFLPMPGTHCGEPCSPVEFGLSRQAIGESGGAGNRACRRPFRPPPPPNRPLAQFVSPASCLGGMLQRSPRNSSRNKKAG